VSRGRSPAVRIEITLRERTLMALALGSLVALAVAGLMVVHWTALASARLWIVVGLLAIAGFLVGVMLSVALGASAAVGARVRQLREIAGDLGSGDLSVRAPVEPYDDLGSLGLALNAMADRVARVLQAQKDLLSGVSHELRSPLARIAVALELIRQEFESARAAAPGGEDRRHDAGPQLLTDILEEVALLERHIQRLLEAQRVGVDRVLVQRADVVLDELAATVLHREGNRLNERGFVVEAQFGAPGLVLSGDANALDRVLSTLIQNVIEHTGDSSAPTGVPAAKSLRVETERVGHDLVVRVLDRGPGLTAEQCSRVFEAFYRTDASRTRNTGGTGLGLYVVKKLTEAHGGSARATPRPGGGLLIELRLPLPGAKMTKETVRRKLPRAGLGEA
jgi:two-component system sensor histidine kinase BaeS